MPIKRASPTAKSEHVFGRTRKAAKMFRAGLYARVSTKDQQTLAMQSRAMREYAARRGWRVAVQVREVNSGAAKREAREKLLEAARRREIDVVLVWRLDRWGRSVTDLLATLQELDHLGVGFVSLTEALDLTTPAGRAMAGLLGIFARVRTRNFAGELGLAWPMRGRTGNGWVGRQPRPYTPRKSGNCIVPALANPKSLPGSDRPHLGSPYLDTWKGEVMAKKWVLGGPGKHRKQIDAGEKVPLELTERERDLIMKHTFAGNNLTDRFRIVPSPGRRPFYRFTLDDLDELTGYVAAEANHAKNKKLEKELRRLYSRIADVLESYTDDPYESTH